MAKETYITLKPKHEALNPYIAYYYFNASQADGYIKEYIFYPHYRNALTVYKNSEISFTAKTSMVTPKPDKPFELIYTGIHSEARTGKILAPFDKIGIVFQPLGINNLFPEALSTVIKESPTSDLNYFGSHFIETLEHVYATGQPANKVQLLNDFFVSHIHPFQEERLLKAIDLIFNKGLGVAEISDALNIHRKTLLRLFQKHLNCSPKEFSNVVKFRKAINTYQEHKPALTNLAYRNDYYDQSDFIKHFKKITGFNPKKFFSNLSHLGTEDTFWTLLNSK